MKLYKMYIVLISKCTDIIAKLFSYYFNVCPIIFKYTFVIHVNISYTNA